MARPGCRFISIWLFYLIEVVSGGRFENWPLSDFDFQCLVKRFELGYFTAALQTRPPFSLFTANLVLKFFFSLAFPDTLAWNNRW